MNILIVDDNPTNRKLLRVTLEAEGFPTLEAGDGVDALAALEQQSVDAVITDILMPRMDGFRLCYELRRHKRFCHVPVIMYSSTYTSPGDEKLALKSGANRFLRKPCPVTTMVETIQAVVEETRQRRPQPATAPKELEVMHDYSEALMRKLEEKNADLNNALEALQASREALEERVHERTRELTETVQQLQTEIQQRHQAEAQLKALNDQLHHRATQLRALAGELTLTEQRERRRIAKILHDHLQQLLVATKYRLSALKPDKVPRLRQDLAEIDDLLAESIQVSRSLTMDLSPPILHEGNLIVCLEWLVHWMAEKHGLEVKLTKEEGLPPLREDLKILLFEAVRELLFNTVKHAQVKEATVDIRQSQNAQLQLTVQDQGRGFVLNQMTLARTTGGGFGLFSIHERLELVDGKVEIDAAPGRGSRFILTVSIEPGPI